MTHLLRNNQNSQKTITFLSGIRKNRKIPILKIRHTVRRIVRIGMLLLFEKTLTVHVLLVLEFIYILVLSYICIMYMNIFEDKILKHVKDDIILLMPDFWGITYAAQLKPLVNIATQGGWGGHLLGQHTGHTTANNSWNRFTGNICWFVELNILKLWFSAKMYLF